MSKRKSNWHVPADWLFHFSLLFALACAVLLASVLLPIAAQLKTSDVATLYGCGVGTGIIGILLLFVARLPLYRERRFWTIGPRALDRTHRRVYWLAYTMVVISLLLFWIVWLRTR